MRIIRIISTVDPRSGGPIEALVRSSEEMAKAGHETEVVSLDLPGEDYLSCLPIKVYPLGERNLLSRVRYSSKLTPWLKLHANQYDVGIIEGLWNYSSIGAWRAFSGGKLPYVVFAHGMLDPWFKQTYPFKHIAKTLYWTVGEGLVARDAAYVLFTAEDERELARNVFPVHRYREKVIALGTADSGGGSDEEVAAWHEIMPGLDGRRYVLFLSRVHPKKGCDILIRAFARFSATYPNIDLVIAGPDSLGWQSELRALGQSLGIASRLHWPGMLTGNHKAGAFKAADAFVLPSHQENFGVVVAEAMSFRTPVLISNKVNIWREIDKSAAGLVSDDTEEGTYQLLNRFYSLSATERSMMSIAARECFLKHFEISRTVRGFTAVLAEVIRQ